METRIAALRIRGDIHRRQADFDTALQLHQNTLRVLTDHREIPHHLKQTIWLHVQIGDTLRLQRRLAEAEHHQKEAVRLLDMLTPADPVIIATAHNGLGVVLKDEGRLDEAEREYQCAGTVVASSHSIPIDLQACLLHNIAGLHHARGDHGQAERFIREALAVRARSRRSDPTGSAADLGVLGAVLIGQGRLGAAEQALASARSRWVSAYGSNHYEVSMVDRNLAILRILRHTDQPVHPTRP